MLKGGKDARIGLLLLMTSMNTVAGEPESYETEPNAYKLEWWALILCVLVGALSVLHWLRYYVMEVIKYMFIWMKENGTITEIENEKIKKGVQHQEVQVTQWLDCSLWTKYEEQIHDMEDQPNDMRQEMLRAKGLI